MPDREKVIKGLEACIDREPGKYDCYKCPYETDGNDCEINLSKDALALLKEQEVPAVPLDKLCELLAEAGYVVPCRICEYCDTEDCAIFNCPSTAEDWRNALTKWMEGLDDHR